MISLSIQYKRLISLAWVGKLPLLATLQCQYIPDEKCLVTPLWFLTQEIKTSPPNLIIHSMQKSSFH